MKIALVGCAPTWKFAPFDDPTWQVWAHTSAQPRIQDRRVDRWFDLHRVEVWRQGKVWYRGAGTYVEWLRSRTVPVVMQQHYPLVPTSERYPLRDIAEHFGIVPASLGLTEGDPRFWDLLRDRGEFSSTFAFMAALALYEGVDELALYGIDFWGQDGDPIADYERRSQRPGAKYWVGVARGMGVPVNVPAQSWFQRQDFLYGYEAKPALAEGVPV